MHERAAAAWVVLVLLGLLIGLLLFVIALGTARHLRKSRRPGETRLRRSGRTAQDLDADEEEAYRPGTARRAGHSPEEDP